MAGRESQRWRWSDLTRTQRLLLATAAAGELSLKVAALIDMQRRPPSQIRGPKALWRAAMVVNLLGPVSYFAFGRKNAPVRPGPGRARPGAGRATPARRP
jgi:hypothetical protein